MTTKLDCHSERNIVKRGNLLLFRYFCPLISCGRSSRRNLWFLLRMTIKRVAVPLQDDNKRVVSSLREDDRILLSFRAERSEAWESSRFSRGRQSAHNRAETYRRPMNAEKDERIQPVSAAELKTGSLVKRLPVRLLSDVGITTPRYPYSCLSAADRRCSRPCGPSISYRWP